MKKSILKSVTLLITFICLIPLIISTVSATEESAFTYTVSDGEATITGYDAYLIGKLNIPASIDGYPVTAIGTQAFSGCNYLTDVTLPDSITTIGYEAFGYCSSLNTVSFSSKLEVIDERAFFCCSKLTNVVIPQSVTTIGVQAFYECIQLTEIVIPNGVSVIEDYAFCNCTNLSSVSLPDGITEIGVKAFSNCKELVEITLPESVILIDSYAFDSSGLIEITIPEYVERINNYTFENCRNLRKIYYNGSSAQWEQIYKKGYMAGSIASRLVCKADYAIGLLVRLSDDESYYAVAGIGNYSGNELIIPDKFKGLPIREIDSHAFSGCSFLSSVKISANIDRIGDYAFANCNQLAKIEFLGSAPSFAENVFQNTTANAYCKSEHTGWTDSVMLSYGGTITWFKQEQVPIRLDYEIQNGEAVITGYVGTVTDLVIPTMIETYPVTKIAGYAFTNRSDITSVSLPDCPITIEESAFEYCDALQAICLYPSLKELESYAFDSCPSGITVYVNGNENQWADIAKSEYWYSKRTYYISYLGDFTKQLSFAPIQSSSYCVTGLQSNAPADLIIPEIYHCKPVTEICPQAFYNNASITTAVLPKNLTTIGAQAFGYCENLKQLFFNGTSQQWAAVEKASNWNVGSSFEVICLGDYAQGLAMTPSPDGSYYIVSGIGTYTGRRVMIPPIYKGKPVQEIAIGAFADCTNILIVYIPDTIQTVGYNAFAGCTNLRYNTYDDALYLGNAQNPYLVLVTGDDQAKTCTIHTDTKVIADYAFFINNALTGVTMPEGLTVIGDSAFCSCNSLSSITIPKSVRRIGTSAFSYCENLTSAVILEGVTYIPNQMFLGCGKLKSVTIPNTVVSIGPRAFCYCYSLSNAKLPDSITSIDDEAFWYCNSLTVINIPEGVTHIGVLAFSGCNQLSNIRIPNGVQVIKEMTFSYCTNLKSVEIPESVTAIDYGAFCQCENLTNVVIPDGVTSIGIRVFEGCHKLNQVTIPNSMQTISTEAFLDCSGLKTVYYYGTEDQWYNVDVQSGNNDLNNANIIYLCNHQYDHNCDSTCNSCGQIRKISHSYQKWQNVNDQTHSRSCLICQHTETAAHNWNSRQIVQKPTDNAPGIIVYICGDCDARKTVEVDYIPGDFDCDARIDNKDVEYLLWHTLFPEDYPIVIDADFDNNGVIDNRDVEYLLWHTLFPEDYPIM